LTEDGEGTNLSSKMGVCPDSRRGKMEKRNMAKLSQFIKEGQGKV